MPAEIPEDEVRHKDAIVFAALRTKMYEDYPVESVKTIENIAQ